MQLADDLGLSYRIDWKGFPAYPVTIVVRSGDYAGICEDELVVVDTSALAIGATHAVHLHELLVSQVVVLFGHIVVT